jgi:hypothetical protein
MCEHRAKAKKQKKRGSNPFFFCRAHYSPLPPITPIMCPLRPLCAHYAHYGPLCPLMGLSTAFPSCYAQARYTRRNFAPIWSSLAWSCSSVLSDCKRQSAVDQLKGGHSTPTHDLFLVSSDFSRRVLSSRHCGPEPRTRSASVPCRQPPVRKRGRGRGASPGPWWCAQMATYFALAVSRRSALT